MTLVLGEPSPLFSNRPGDAADGRVGARDSWRRWRMTSAVESMARNALAAGLYGARERPTALDALVATGGDIGQPSDDPMESCALHLDP